MKYYVFQRFILQTSKFKLNLKYYFMSLLRFLAQPDKPYYFES